MTIGFLISLLCAITGCPAPVIQESNQNPVGLLNQIQLGRNYIGSASSRVEVVRLPRLLSGDNVDLNQNEISAGHPFVVTKLGNIIGRYMKSRSGKDIAAFEGIPYAKPPINDLRFRDPIPVEPWFGKNLVANKTKSDCLQLDFIKMFQVRGAEDCLYMNIYTPVNAIQGNSVKEGLPVLIFIHGGGWMCHSGNFYGPRYLLDKDVILVTLNFRLGVLGFLSTGDSSSHGNWGLKDQFLAMKFLRDHIESFGAGNVKKFTLIGESTGAGAVSHHIISPRTSKEIPIYGAIMMSGSSLNHWGLINDTFSNTKAIARRMFCPTKRSDKLVECLRKQDPYMLVGQQLHLWAIPTISRLLFGPVIESTIDNSNPFITEAPEVTYRNRRDSIDAIPVISGINKNEGATFAVNAYLVPFLFNAINNDWNKMGSYMMAYDRLSGVNVAETSEKISKFYLNGKKWSYERRYQISDLLGDRTISTGVYKFLHQHSRVANTYGYFFTHPGKSSFINQAGMRTSDWGVSHGDELHFIFSMDTMYGDLTHPKDVEMSRFMVDIVTNFAQDRQPFPNNVVSENETWSPILNPKYMELLEINTKSKMIPFPFKERMKFWESLHLN